MEDVIAQIQQIKFELEGLKTRERGALDLIYPTQIVTAAGGAASIRFPAVGSFPTNFKSLKFSGRLRGIKNATFDALQITVNAVAAGYYQELDYATAAVPAAAEQLAGASWTTGISALTAPAGIFSQFEMTIFDYATAYNTLMEMRHGLVTSLLSGNIYTRSLHGFINSAQAVTSITFACAGGNIAQNSYLSCYGVSG